MAAVDVLLRYMVEHNASDVHLTSGLRPYMRIHGEMRLIEAFDVQTSSGILALLNEVMSDYNRTQFRNEYDTDFDYEVTGLGRFRVNGFLDMRGTATVMRQIPEQIPTFEELGLPAVLRTFCAMSKGLVVVTGPTGSGKSTTLAAMIDLINKTRAEHIITIEDPIEFVHRPIKCLINQREVHRDTTSFAHALRAALREDPDIVLVGELRDLETMETAIEMAETGHLVFATLHTNTAATTVDRIIDKFPADRQNHIRTMLGDALKGVVAQTLCQKIGGGRIASFEILVVNVPAANHIREGKTFMIPTVMQTSRSIGMQTFSDDLVHLVLKGKITPAEAYFKSIDKETVHGTMQNAGIPMDFMDASADEAQAAEAEQARATRDALRVRCHANPEDAAALNDLAWLLATSPIDELRSGKEAVRLAECVRDLTKGRDPAVLDTLAAAYAETGHFSRAMEWARKAIGLAAAQDKTPLAVALNMRLREYSQNRPHRDL